MKCDKQMKEKKERAAKQRNSIDQWKCTGKCERCICGMKQNPDGTWRHN